MTARTPTDSDLGRLAAFAEALFIACEFAKIDARPLSEPDWRTGTKRLTQATAAMIRERIEAGHLLDAAEDLVHPLWGCCCGLRFLAQAEPFLDPEDVRRLHALSVTEIDWRLEIADWELASE